MLGPALPCPAELMVRQAGHAYGWRSIYKQIPAACFRDGNFAGRGWRTIVAE